MAAGTNRRCAGTPLPPGRGAARPVEHQDPVEQTRNAKVTSTCAKVTVPDADADADAEEGPVRGDALRTGPSPGTGEAGAPSVGSSGGTAGRVPAGLPARGAPAVSGRRDEVGV
ncbi:hypothetical protein [Streptomyces noursei]|uniref:hypothetical protein n=1 Tax=Streptomyces noursei TaxID=1971 RepID=UPI0007CD777F|nr:hypothetical protein A4V12_11365 [Streptomyces noursei]